MTVISKRTSNPLLSPANLLMTGYCKSRQGRSATLASPRYSSNCSKRMVHHLSMLTLQETLVSSMTLSKRNTIRKNYRAQAARKTFAKLSRRLPRCMFQLNHSHHSLTTPKPQNPLCSSDEKVNISRVFCSTLWETSYQWIKYWFYHKVRNRPWTPSTTPKPQNPVFICE
jgi:hypothetical protein